MTRRIERDAGAAIVIGTGQFLVARASAAGVSAVGFGFEEA